MTDTIAAFLRENAVPLGKITEFMLAANAHTNLTRITEPAEIVEKHYIDSVLPLTMCDVPRGTSMLDVGSGAGFPGIPVKLFRPDLRVTLLDCARKRTDYLTGLLAFIGVDCTVLRGRSEELSRLPAHRERYGLVTARAVANLAALCEYCLPFAEPGGIFLAMKGDDCTREICGSEHALQLLGGELISAERYALPSGDRRTLVVVRKIRPTPPEFPRQRTNIGKNPL
jgi:16S rRNA (guanine(527)-N(7))-methyltransferase RsmG